MKLDVKPAEAEALMGFWERVLKRHRERRLAHWEQLWFEAHGRVLDIEMGAQGVTWRRANRDRAQAESCAAYYREKLRTMTGGAT